MLCLPLQVGGRLLKYSYHIARVSSWVEMRMRAALTKNMVFPGGTVVWGGRVDRDVGWRSRRVGWCSRRTGF